MRKKTPYRGSSLIEYALPLTIFCFTAIFMIMTTDLPAEIALFFQDTVNGNGQGGTIRVKSYGTLAPAKEGQNTQQNTTVPPPAAGFTNVQITLGSNKKITLQNYPADLAEYIETAGASGTTSVLASRLKDLTNQLLEEGEIEEAQANLLIDLANQGFRMAEIESILENSADEAVTNNLDVWNMQVQFDGQPRLVYEFANDIGWVGVSASTVLDNPLQKDYMSETQTTSTGGPEMSKFIDLYNQALETGAMSNPVIQQIVGSLAKEIVFVGAMAQDQFSSYDGYEDYKLNKSYLNMVNEYSVTTNIDSAGICATGQGSVSGSVQCVQ